MTKLNSLNLDIVSADRATGLWLDKPEATGDTVYAQDWAQMLSTEQAHYDTYEVALVDETGEVVGDETRALIIRWVD